MNGEGIMALPQGMGAATGGINDLAPFVAAQDALKSVGTNAFSRELLSAGAEINPQEVSQFLDEIRDAGLTEEDRQVIREILDRVKDDPQNYTAIRAALLTEGYPEDLLPPTFDPEFFVALEIAVEADVTMEQQSMPAPEVAPEIPGFAEGGIVSLKPIAKALQDMGRGGDTLLAHITPMEAALLKRSGGSGTINPHTGLPEYKSLKRRLKKVFKAVTKPIRAVGKAAKKFAKSTVGRVVLTVALGAFLGPAAAGFLSVSSVAGVAAVSAGIGAFGSGILAGDSFKDSLRNGVKAAALAGVGTAAYGGITGTDVTSAGSYTGPKTLGETADFYRNKVDNLLGTSPTGAEAVSPTAPIEGAGQAGTASDYMTSGDAQNLTRAAQDEGMRALTEGIPQRDILTPRPGDLDFSTLPSSQVTTSPSGFDYSPTSTNYPASATTAKGATSAAAGTTPTAATAPTQAATQGPGFFERAGNFIQNPSFSGFKDVFVDPTATTHLGKYGPLYATGLGLTYLAGGMKGKEADPKPLYDYEDTGLQYMRRTPDIMAGSLGQSKTYDYQSMVPTPGDFGMPQVSKATVYQPTGITAIPTAQGVVQPYNVSGLYGIPNIYAQNVYGDEEEDVYTAKRGSGPMGVRHFPRKTGPINGPGTGTSDSIPAMLSDGEFVFTAKAVRNMGGGSRRKGAARMYKMMKMLEGGPVGIAKKG